MEKKEILNVIEHFLSTMENKSFKFAENTKMTLELYGEPTETYLHDIYLAQTPRRAEDKLFIITQPILDEMTDVDSVSTFSTEECHKILCLIKDAYYHDEYKKIYDYLNEHDADFDEIYQTTDRVDISISWGDWKHSHGRLDYLMKQMGYIDDGQEVTEEDGSDTYSAMHFYLRPTKNPFLTF